MSSEAGLLAAIDPTPCWCGSKNWVVQFRSQRFGLVRCPSCTTFRLDPRPLQRDDAIPTFYTEFYTAIQEQEQAATGNLKRGSSRFWRVVRQVPYLDRPGEAVLDVGCGDGHLCGDLKRGGWTTVMGIDVSVARIESARRRYPDVAFYESIDAAPIAPGSVELIIMDNVIEHLLEPASTARRVRAWLQEGGRLVVITPSMVSGHFRLLGRRWTPELSPDQHIFLFTPPALARLLTAVGLTVEAQGSFHLPPYPWRPWLSALLRGDVKEAVWRLGQELGAMWGRVIGAGPMLYAVARAPGATASADPVPNRRRLHRDFRGGR